MAIPWIFPIPFIDIDGDRYELGMELMAKEVTQLLDICGKRYLPGNGNEIHYSPKEIETPS